jgi:hypothetical protein
MTYEPEQVVLGWVIRFLQQRMAWVILLVVGACALLLRCLHLLNPAHYYILSADSYYFHWLSGRVMAGKSVTADAAGGALQTMQSGLSYPLAYIAKGMSFVFHITSGESLDLVARFLPPVVGVISMLVVYLAAARIFGRRVGLFSALAWALMLQSIWITAGGFLDRDGLSTFMILIGVILFYFSRSWHVRLGSRDIGWLIAGLGVLGIEASLYLEWDIVGSLMLLAVIIGYVVVKYIVEFLSRKRIETNIMGRMRSVMNEVNWKTLAVVILGNAAVVLAFHDQFLYWYRFLWAVLTYHGAEQANELRGLELRDLLIYHVFVIPMVVGLYIAWKRRSDGLILLATWYLLYLVVSLYSRRVLFYTVPAAAILSGVGLLAIWDWAKQGGNRTLKRAGTVVLLILILSISFVTASALGTDPTQAVDQGWQDALAYLRSETPQDSVIMTQWTWGYYILDVGQRRSLVDPGFYGYPADRLADVSLAYTTSDPSEAASVMAKNGAQYLVFSTLDLDVASAIMSWGNSTEKLHNFPNDSLIELSLTGKFESGGGLRMVYRTANSEVVILGLAQPELQY